MFVFSRRLQYCLFWGWMVLRLSPSNWNFRSWVRLWAMHHPLFEWILLYSSSLRLHLEVSTDSNSCRVKTQLPLALACKGLHEKDRVRVFGLSESLLLPISKGYLEINWIKHDIIEWLGIGGSESYSSVHGIFQARILDWVAISYSRGSSWPRDWTQVSSISCIGRQILYHWATWESL